MHKTNTKTNAGTNETRILGNKTYTTINLGYEELM